ncbi:MAG TPA: CHAT domain-containing protein [Propionibacteriaceae bacterium]
MVETADPNRFAELLSRPTRDEEDVLVTYFGEDRYNRLHEQALRSNLRRTADKPLGNVVVLHGIMGGQLTGTDSRARNRLLWLQAGRVLGISGGLAALELDAEGLREVDEGLTVGASGMLKRHYGELLLQLSERWRVRPFWFDWRKDLRLSGRALATAITGWFPPDEPVHLVAHSMGGLVARSFIADHPDLWASMWDKTSEPQGRAGGRLVMLGTPNHGSFAIPRVIAGNERLVKLLALADVRMSKGRLRDVLNTFVGTYQMLPSPLADRSAEPLYRAETYAPLRVSQQHLETARKHHERLSTVIDAQRMVYVAGYGQRTYTSMVDPQHPLSDSSYQLSLNGDGRVPHALGQLRDETAKVPTYYAPASHGGLTSHPDVLAALEGILTTGHADRLAMRAPDLRTTVSEAELRKQERDEDEQIEEQLAALVRQLGTRGRARGGGSGSAPVRDRPEPAETAPLTAAERHLEDALVEGWLSGPRDARSEVAPAPTSTAPPPRIQLALTEGDIGDAHTVAAGATGGGDPTELPVDTIAVGHYLGVKPQAAELGLDKAISGHYPEGGRSGPDEEGVLTQLTLRGTISGSLGQPFFLPDPRDPARLLAIAGMDVPGRFGAGELTIVARELCWAVGRLGRRHLATVLIGAGYGNLSATRAVESWMDGVAQSLSGQLEDARLQRITIVEQDPRRLAEIDRALVQMRDLMGREGRLQVDYPGATPELAEQWRQSALQRAVKEAEEHWKDGGTAGPSQDPRPARLTITRDGDSFRFGAITDAAAVPEREIPLDPALVTEANDQLAAEPEAGRSNRDGVYLGKLLFPGDLQTTLRGAPLVLMLDSTTARVHWELIAHSSVAQNAALDDGAGKNGHDRFAQRLGIGGGVTRQLRTVFAPPPEPPPPPERRLRVLVVADPAEDAHLPGAEEEGILVADLFERYNTHEHPDRVEVVRLFGPREATRSAVLRELMTKRFHVLHFAGHCFYNKEYPPGSGWIFSNQAVLSARELRRIDRVPEFVFSNACESGVTPDRTGKRTAELAPSFAESFFARGVGNFVCTAWPVDDQGAQLFADTLYTRLLGLQAPQARPDPMYLAMAEARRTVATSRGGGARSWGAYQHYGDPLFRLVTAQPA